MIVSLHLGHLGELAGHDHWVAGAAIGAIAVAGLIGRLKGGRPAEGDAASPEPDADGTADGADADAAPEAQPA